MALLYIHHLKGNPANAVISQIHPRHDPRSNNPNQFIVISL